MQPAFFEAVIVMGATVFFVMGAALFLAYLHRDKKN